MPRACSTVSSASESLPRPSTVVSSRSGRVRSVVTGPWCRGSGRVARQAGPTARSAGADGDGDQPLGELATVRGRAVGPEQAPGEVHAVDDQVDLGGEVFAVARGDLLGQALQAHVQL